MKVTRRAHYDPDKEFLGMLLGTGILGVFGLVGALNSNYKGEGAEEMNAAKWKGVGYGALGHLGVLLVTYLLQFVLSNLAICYVIAALLFVLIALLVRSVKKNKNPEVENLLKEKTEKSDPAGERAAAALTQNPAANNSDDLSLLVEAFQFLTCDRRKDRDALRRFEQYCAANGKSTEAVPIIKTFRDAIDSLSNTDYPIWFLTMRKNVEKDLKKKGDFAAAENIKKAGTRK